MIICSNINLADVESSNYRNKKGRAFLMEITEVKVKRVKSSGNMKGVAHVTLDGVFVIHDIKVIVPTNGKEPFIAMPSRRDQKTGKWKDIAHPIKNNDDPSARDFRAELQNAIFEKFNELPEDDAEEVVDFVISRIK